MSFPNVSDIVATTIEKRSKKIADNVTRNNALLVKLSSKGKIRPFSGGRLIYEELSFAENGNAAWYSGYDTLATAAQDVLSAAEFSIKQLAVPVTVSGLEELQNAGQEAFLDLLEARIGVAESTMKNYICDGLYSDGTGSSSKEITGLDAAVPADPTTGTYGGIDRSAWTFWRSQLNDVTLDATNVKGEMTELMLKCIRGADKPDLIIAGNTAYTFFMASLQTIQRVTSSKMAEAGFESTSFMGADVVPDGGLGGFADAEDMYFLNTDYLHFRPHSKRNMVALSPERRYAVNQDATVQILAWAGNLTCSGAQFQGRITGD